MGKPIIMVSSITYAMKGRDLLNNRGFTAYLQRTPKMTGVSGCGYSIHVPHHIDEAVELLQQAGIKILGQMVWEDEG